MDTKTAYPNLRCFRPRAFICHVIFFLFSSPFRLSSKCNKKFNQTPINPWLTMLQVCTRTEEKLKSLSEFGRNLLNGQYLCLYEDDKLREYNSTSECDKLLTFWFVYFTRPAISTNEKLLWRSNKHWLQCWAAM